MAGWFSLVFIDPACRLSVQQAFARTAHIFTALGLRFPTFSESVPLPGCSLIMLYNVFLCSTGSNYLCGRNYERGIPIMRAWLFISPSLAKFPFGSCPPPHCARDVVNGSGGRRIDPKAAKRPSERSGEKGWVGGCLAKSRKWQVAVVNEWPRLSVGDI
jgi:hypothetical protein